jgi:beta-galactosidase
MKVSEIFKTALIASMLSLAPNTALQARSTGTFTTGEKTFLLNGKPFIVKAAEMHYPRIPRPYWEQRIKMCKALGMNTICLYVFWNIHEQQEGKYDFTGNNDVAAFCRLAQKNGMYVIVRPGPYVCAEWEMGGLPWWLLKKKDIKLRTQDPFFMERVKLFEKEVGKQLAPLTIQNGGPIIMVQVENEYGSYGTDKPYVSAIRDIVKESGFDNVTLFQCDWSSNFTNNGLDDLCWTMNFGTGANIDQQFRRLGELRPNAPKMCSEFWSGWFDKWGARHETRPAKDMVEGLQEMLNKGISFSLYMTHGGTSFGHWAGANSPGFAPDVTSYDYDAPITEWGTTTPKYFALRDMMAKFNDGKKLPDIPKANDIISVPKFRLSEYAPLESNLSKATVCRDIKTMEDFNMGWGSMIYQTILPGIKGQSTLYLNEAHDYAQIFIDGKYIGKVDRVNGEKQILLPSVKEGSKLTIFIEAMGRINFGQAIKDYKGITNSVIVKYQKDGNEYDCNLKNWNIICIPDDYQTAINALNNKIKSPIAIQSKAGYYRGYFDLKKVGDTFLNFESFSKGQVYVNGHALGRIWRIGPQQTLYTPGCWLKKGRNEVIVLDVVGPKEETMCEGFDKPELNKLNLEKPNVHDDIAEKPSIEKLTPVYTGTFADGNGWQNITFGKPVTGRYLCIEALSSQNGKEYACIAELYTTDVKGSRLSRESWTVKYADSEDADNGNKTLDKVFDLQESTYWSTCKGIPFPHTIVIDLGTEQTINGIQYLPRAEQGAPASIKDFKVFVY